MRMVLHSLQSGLKTTQRDKRGADVTRLVWIEMYVNQNGVAPLENMKISPNNNSKSPDWRQSSRRTSHKCSQIEDVQPSPLAVFLSFETIATTLWDIDKKRVLCICYCRNGRIWTPVGRVYMYVDADSSVRERTPWNVDVDGRFGSNRLWIGRSGTFRNFFSEVIPNLILKQLQLRRNDIFYILAIYMSLFNNSVVTYD